jgi:hypothetical protein
MEAQHRKESQGLKDPTRKGLFEAVSTIDDDEVASANLAENTTFTRQRRTSIVGSQYGVQTSPVLNMNAASMATAMVTPDTADAGGGEEGGDLFSFFGNGGGGGGGGGGGNQESSSGTAGTASLLHAILVGQTQIQEQLSKQSDRQSIMEQSLTRQQQSMASLAHDVQTLRRWIVDDVLSKLRVDAGQSPGSKSPGPGGKSPSRPNGTGGSLRLQA